MTPDELQEIIQKIEASTSPENANFGIFRYGEHHVEGCIKANGEGLKLFAAELLAAAYSFEHNEHKEYHHLEYLPDWVSEGSDIIIDYVEPVPNLIEAVTYEVTWRDKLSDFGCLIMMGILVVSILVGLKSIFS